MRTIKDVEKSGRCVSADRVPCPKAREYLDKKGLICKTKKPETPGIFDKFIDGLVDRRVSALQRRLESILDDWFLPPVRRR